MIRPEVWQHVAAVVEGGRVARLYLTGAAVAEKTVGRALCENSEPLVFGRDPWPGHGATVPGPAMYQGPMDEVRIWARALTPEEVRAESQAPRPGP